MLSHQHCFFQSKECVLLSIALAGLMDALDGAVARLTDSVSKRGAFLDSTIDRLSDTIIILALIPLKYPTNIVITLLVSSLMVSYCRARADSLGLNLQSIGFVERAERILGIIITILVSYLNQALSIVILLLLTILTVITFIHRFLYALSKLDNR
ncbi:MAG: CDP-alcohol phosphatidyltransferase family protein [Desulfurococcaceae archaeon]